MGVSVAQLLHVYSHFTLVDVNSFVVIAVSLRWLVAMKHPYENTWNSAVSVGPRVLVTALNFVPWD